MEKLSPNSQKLEELQQQLKQLLEQFPKHSTPPAMMMLMDELEDQIERLEYKISNGQHF